MRSIPPLFNPILAVWDVSAHFWIAPPSEGCIKGGGFPESCENGVQDYSSSQEIG